MTKAKATIFQPVRLTKAVSRDLGFLARHFKQTKGGVMRDLIEREAAQVRSKLDRAKAAK